MISTGDWAGILKFPLHRVPSYSCPRRRKRCLTYEITVTGFVHEKYKRRQPNIQELKLQLYPPFNGPTLLARFAKCSPVGKEKRACKPSCSTTSSASILIATSCANMAQYFAVSAWCCGFASYCSGVNCVVGYGHPASRLEQGNICLAQLDIGVSSRCSSTRLQEINRKWGIELHAIFEVNLSSGFEPWTISVVDLVCHVPVRWLKRPGEMGGEA